MKSTSPGLLSLLTKPAVFLLTAFIILFSNSCKKDGTPVAELIVAKWNVTSQYNYIHVDGKVSTEPFDTYPGSYFDFKSTGKVNVKLGESSETEYNYAIQSGDKQVVFTKDGGPSMVYNINKIGSANLELANRLEQTGTDNYSETRIVFSK